MLLSAPSRGVGSIFDIVDLKQNVAGSRLPVPLVAWRIGRLIRKIRQVCFAVRTISVRMPPSARSGTLSGVPARAPALDLRTAAGHGVHRSFSRPVETSVRLTPRRAAPKPRRRPPRLRVPVPLDEGGLRLAWAPSRIFGGRARGGTGGFETRAGLFHDFRAGTVPLTAGRQSPLDMGSIARNRRPGHRPARSCLPVSVI
jgi:hypothetical protein